MIQNHIQKVKEWIEENNKDIYIAAIIFLVGLASFGLGRLSVLWPKKEPITITNNQLPIINKQPTITNNDANKLFNDQQASAISTVKGKYVASKNGSYYHLPWCPGAQRIKKENQIWFGSKEEAEKAGYKPASNCNGL